MSTNNYVDGKTIVITGGGGGFGKLVAMKTAALGGRVVAADIDEASLKETCAEIAAQGGEIEGVRADVTDRGSMRALATKAVDRFGSIDVMVNNAGVMPLAFYSDHEAAADAWERCIDINIKGVLNGIVAVYDQMTQQGRGHVVNLSSIYGNQPTEGAAVYGASKAAVNFLSESLRQECQGRIKVTTIRPTGVAGTNLGAGVINPEAIRGILGIHTAEAIETNIQLMTGDAPPETIDPEQIGYASLSPELLADQIVFAINQPWGVSIGDLTIRASGDRFMI